MGYGSWGRRESDMDEQLRSSSSMGLNSVDVLNSLRKLGPTQTYTKKCELWECLQNTLLFLNTFLFLTVFSSKYQSRFNLDASFAMKSFFCSHSEDSSLLHVFKAVYLHFYFSGYILPFLVVVQLLRSVRLFVTPWTAACQAFLYFIISQTHVP